MFTIISKLHDLADKLDDQGREELSDRLDKIASFLVEALRAYKPRIRRQKKIRGAERVKRRQRYKVKKHKIKRQQKKYRRKRKTQLKRRRRMKHYKRVGNVNEENVFLKFL